MKDETRTSFFFSAFLLIALLIVLFALFTTAYSNTQVTSNSPATLSGTVSSPAQTAVARSLWVGEEKTVLAVSLADGQPSLYINIKRLEDLAVDNDRKVVWVGTKKEIIQYKFDGSENFRYPLKHRKQSNTDDKDCQDEDNNDDGVRISLDLSDGSLWVGAGKEVFKLSFDNHELFRLTGFDHIVDVSVDVADSSCWVGQNHKIGKYSSDGTALLNFTLEQGNMVHALAADASSHGLWIGSRKGLMKADTLGTEIFRTNEPDDIQDLKVNTANNALWLVTKKNVYKYTKDGQKLFIVPLCSKYNDDDHAKQHDADKTGEAHPSCSDDDHDREKDCEGNLITLGVNSIDDTCWVASRKTLFKLSDSGALLLRVPGFMQIAALDIGLPKIGITITEPLEGAVFDTSPITVKGIITDPTATVDVNGTTATITGLDFEAQNVLLSSGTNTITATATNLARQKATDTVHVTYTPQNSGPSLLLCVERFREQTPKPPSEGCAQLITVNTFALVTGLLDETAVSVTLNNVLIPEGTYIYNQGDILNGTRQGTFFWAFVQLPLADGAVSFSAIATDAQGGRSSALVTVIKDTVAPNIAITSPPDGTVTREQVITITGVIDDPTAEVRFDWTGATIPVVNGGFSVPYNLGTWDVPRDITITTRDPAGNPSAAYLTVIRDATSPQINVTAPMDGMVTNSQTISITGTVVDQNPGTITVSINGGSAQPLTVSGTSFSGTASLTSGNNSLLFTAIDRADNISTLTRVVTLDQEPPLATVTGIQPNANLTGTATITVNASDVLSGIQSVTLLVDNILKATLTQEPYTFNLDTFMLAAGNHTITVRVLDKAGNQTEQNIPVTVQHQFGIQITSPGTGVVINKSSAIIRGTITLPANQEIGVTVNGVLAEQQGTNFAAIVPLQQGQNTITATATNVYGIQEQTSVTINTDSIQDQLRFTAAPESGIPMTKPDGTVSFDTTMNVETYITGTIANYAWDPNGDGTADQTGELLTQITATYQPPGLYFPTVLVTDTIGNTYTETAIVNVLDRNTIDTLLKAKWEGMKGALASGNVEGAVGYFTEDAKGDYRTIFTGIVSQLPALATAMQNINMVEANGSYAEYYIKRQQRGTEISYFIYFVKDSDGLWRIRSF